MIAALTLPIELSAKGMAMGRRWNNRRRKLCIRTSSMRASPDSLMSGNATTTVFFADQQKVLAWSTSRLMQINTGMQVSTVRNKRTLEDFQMAAGNQRAHTRKYKALRGFRLSLVGSAGR